MSINSPSFIKRSGRRSYENIGYGPITLPPFEYDTMGFNLSPPEKWKNRMKEIDSRYIGAAVYGLSYLIRHCAPSLCMADLNDIFTDVSLVLEGDVFKSSLYVFDSIEGGVGYAEKIYEKIEDTLKLCRDVLNECECDSGCPSCVPPIPEGINNEEVETLCIDTNASTECTKSLITALLENKIVDPDIKRFTKKIEVKTEYQPDKEKEKLIEKLKRASTNLSKKREKLH